MAQTTKTYNYGTFNCYSNITWDDVWTSDDKHIYIPISSTWGSQSQTLDFSIIPADAAIISATYNSTYYESVSGEGSQSIRNNNGDFLYYANSANFKTWLSAGNRNGKLWFTYRATPSQREGSAGPSSGYRQYRNVSLTVVFESGTKTWRLHYGIGGSWVEVEAYGAKNGAYVPTLAYYGMNNQWKKLDNVDIGD